MKKCYRCESQWTGFGAQPRAREVCEGCGAYLHCCLNCHHFDAQNSNCKLPHTSFVGLRDSLNYCEEFQMLDSRRRALEDRVSRARSNWEELFRP